MPAITHFKGFSDFSNTLLTQSLSDNLMDFFNWAFLEAGAFTHVPVISPGVNNSYAHEQLMPVHLETVADGTIWQAVNTDWVYETGLDIAEPPTIANGVYVGGVFYPTATTTGTYSHYINYPAGQIVFASPIPVTSVVQAEYSWKWVSLYDQSVPWFRDVVFDAMLLDDQSKSASGVITLLDQHRVQPPLIIIEPVMTRRMMPLELGNESQIIRQDVLFHIMTERADERNNLMDAITLQKDKTIILYDTNAKRAANDFALDWRGMTNVGARMYPTLVSDPPVGFSWRKCFFQNVVGQDITLKLPLYRGVIRVTFEIYYDTM